MPGVVPTPHEDLMKVLRLITSRMTFRQDSPAGSDTGDIAGGHIIRRWKGADMKTENRRGD